ncbi:hypothetical protein HK097_008809, partial [Rhizophlyctis rosea]
MTLPTRKRKDPPWTEEEDVELFNAVVKHQRGNWDSMLNDPDFTFHKKRKPTDLRDRYRHRWPEAFHAVVPPNTRIIHQKAPSRKRRPFTDKENLYLLIGYLKYGTQWSQIHDNDLYPFRRRLRTAEDLRFRFRNIKTQNKWLSLRSADLDQSIWDEAKKLRAELLLHGKISREVDAELFELDGEGGELPAGRVGSDDEEDEEDDDVENGSMNQEEEDEEEEEIPLQRTRKRRERSPSLIDTTPEEVPESIRPPKRRVLPWQAASRDDSPDSPPARKKPSIPPPRSPSHTAAHVSDPPRASSRVSDPSRASSHVSGPSRAPSHLSNPPRASSNLSDPPQTPHHNFNEDDTSDQFFVPDSLPQPFHARHAVIEQKGKEAIVVADSEEEEEYYEAGDAVEGFSGERWSSVSLPSGNGEGGDESEVGEEGDE